jgi:DNA-directed RNA polymerase beta subunit
VLTNEDIVSSSEVPDWFERKAIVAFTDHLSNRRVRTAGEQLYAQFGVGFWPVWRVPSRAHERARQR